MSNLSKDGPTTSVGARHRVHVRVRFGAAVLSVLFVAKALFFAAFITPLWAIPDEVGHVSYVLDLAQNDWSPIYPGRAAAQLDLGVVNHSGGQFSQGNWIAQHPPLYYLVASVATRAALVMTDNVEIIYRSPRLITALVGGLFLYVLIMAGVEAGAKYSVIITGAVLIASTPMFVHLSSGTTNDTAVALFAALLMRRVIRFTQLGEDRDLFWLAIWLLMGSLTKATFWPFAGLAFIGVAIHVLKSEPGVISAGRRLIIPSLVAVAGPALWIAREAATGRSTVAGQLDPGRLPSGDSGSSFFELFESFVTTAAVLDTYFRTFVGLIGWHGGTGPANNNRWPTWFLIDGTPLAFYGTVLFMVGLAALRAGIRAANESIGVSTGADLVLQRARIGVAVATGAFCTLWLQNNLAMYATHPTFDWMRTAGFGLLFSGTLLLACLRLRGLGEAQLVRILFVIPTLMLVYFSFDRMLGWDGSPSVRAVHGRYLVAGVPPLVIGVALSFSSLKMPRVLPHIFALAAVAFEVVTNLTQVLPFYGVYP